jgi:hypothetical protein
MLAFAARAVGPFDLNGRAPEWAAATVGEDLALRPAPTSPMLDLIAGVLRVLDRKEIALLRAAAADSKAVEPPASAVRWCVLHLSTAAPGITAPARRVEVLRDPDGVWYARPLDDDSSKSAPKPVRLNADKFTASAAQWPLYRGSFTPLPGLEPGKPAPLGVPASPGWVTMNRDALGARFLNGRPTSIDGADRVLADQKFLVRLPTGYTPRERCGLFVWVDAGPTAALHQPFWQAADDLRLVIIGAEKTGNGVHASNRYQLALDAAQTAQERFLIDPARVYIGGISGGGRISTQVWACFPDIFTGAVPIVGLDCYESAPAGPGLVHRAGFAKPLGRMWKLLLKHRIAPMTGQPDFNYQEIVKFSGIFRRDRVQLRLFDYADMAHQLPTAPRFLEAISWVDEPARAAAANARDAALAKPKDLPDGAKGTPEWTQRRVAITAADPWSKDAWAAADELNVSASQK